jgi:copper transport protein
MALRLLSRGAFLLALVFALCENVYGHAVLVETIPADGELLAVAPDRIVVRFNEPVSAIAAQVLDATGRDVTPIDAARVHDGELQIALPPSLTTGTYVVSYRVVSLDGHPIGGSLMFSIGERSTRPPLLGVSPDDRGWRVAMAAVRVVLYLGILGGAGGVLFLFLVKPTGRAAAAAARIVGTLALVGCAAALVSIGVQGGLLAGGPARSIANWATWRTGLLSSFGRTAALAFIGLAAIAIGFRRKMHFFAVVGAAAAILSFALSGHVVTAGPKWLTVPLLIAHTSAVSLWVGSLLPLRSAVLQDRAVEIVRRFSNVAVAAVVVLFLAGFGIAALQVRSVAGLVTTAYGWMLLAKLVLVAGLLALATLNKFRLTPLLARGDIRGASGLRLSIAAEIALVVGILIATASLSTTPPPRVFEAEGVPAAELHSPHEHHARGLAVELSSGERRATVEFATLQNGTNAVEITLTDARGKAVEAREVAFAASNPSAGVEPVRRTAVPVRPGVWRVEGLLLVPGGEWLIRVEALVSDFEKPIFEGAVELR